MTHEHSAEEEVCCLGDDRHYLNCPNMLPCPGCGYVENRHAHDCRMSRARNGEEE